MKVAVIGSRSFNNFELLESKLKQLSINQIISGGAKGADTLAALYAQKNEIPTTIIPPNYKKFGRGAPIIRNKEIVSLCDTVVAFWDGTSKGTSFTIEYAQKENKPTIIYRI